MLKKPTDYPDYIINACDQYKNKSIFYFLQVPDLTTQLLVCKFGITTDAMTRLRTHFRKLGVICVIAIIDCKYDSVMRFVETEFKRYAKSIGVMVTKFDNTEILITNEINVYVDRVRKMIDAELLKPQPANVLVKIPAVKAPTVKTLVITPKVSTGYENNVNVDIDCKKCGAKFKHAHHLIQHQKRKTPCILLNVSPAVKDDPNHCIYCNKVYSTKFNLTKHQKKCKIKVDGVKHLPVNIQFEELLRIQSEEFDKKLAEMRKTFDEKLKFEERLKIIEDSMAQVTNNINNIVNVDGDVNNTVNITLNN